MVLVGLVLYSIGGLAPALFQLSFNLLILSRIILGIGLGFVAPLSIIFIEDFYEKESKINMLGLSSAMNNLGTVIAVLFSGIIASINWRYGLFIYSFAILSFILVIFYIPKEHKEIDYKKNSKKISTKLVISNKLYYTFAQIFLGTVIYFIIPTNLSFYLHSISGSKNSILTGVLLALISITGVVSSVLYSKINKLLTKYTLSIVFLSFAVSMFSIVILHNIFTLVIALLVFGFALGIALPSFNKNIIAFSSEENKSVAITLGTSLIFLGQFLSPIFIDLLINFLHLNKTFGAFILGSIFSTILFLIEVYKQKG